MCSSCRTILAKRRIPIKIKLFFCFIVLIFIIAATRFPASLEAGVAYKRARISEKKGNYLSATIEYQIVNEIFPESTTVLGRLAITAYKSENFEIFLDAVSKLEGREIPNDVYIELEKILKEITDSENRDG